MHTSLTLDLLDLPSNTQKGHFVVKLADSLAKAAGPVRNYVVTPSIRDLFDQTHGFISQCLTYGENGESCAMETGPAPTQPTPPKPDWILALEETKTDKSVAKLLMEDLGQQIDQADEIELRVALRTKENDKS